MKAALRGLLDPFVIALLGVVLLASLLPARGQAAVAAGWIADAGIVLLFFLHGAKLCGVVVGDEGADLLAEGEVLGRKVEVHGGVLRSRRDA